MGGLRVLILIVVMLRPAFAGCMDTDVKLWVGGPGQRSIYDKLMTQMACPADVDVDEGRQIDAVACNWFVAKALSTLYGVEDFGPKTNGRWLNANEIVQHIRSHGETWRKLGAGNVQSVLADAAAGAANKQPVIATLEDSPNGHVALVLGGALQGSTKWKDAAGVALKVPNSAAFSLDHVEKAYVFCRLSSAFRDPAKVELWFRVK